MKASSDDGTETSGSNRMETSGDNGMETSADHGMGTSVDNGMKAGRSNGVEISGGDRGNGMESNGDNGMRIRGSSGMEFSGGNGEKNGDISVSCSSVNFLLLASPLIDKPLTIPQVLLQKLLPTSCNFRQLLLKLPPKLSRTSALISAANFCY
jgi:hypothetical protein